MIIEYDPSKMPQVNYKKLQTGQIMLIQLLTILCDGKTMIRMAMNQFQKHMDLNDALDRWEEKETDPKTWSNFRAHFSKEFKKNRTRKGTFKEIGLANAATQEQVETNRENQQILPANSIKQNNIADTLMAQVVALTAAASSLPAQANAATTATYANTTMMKTTTGLHYYRFALHWFAPCWFTTTPTTTTLRCNITENFYLLSSVLASTHNFYFSLYSYFTTYCL
jgi:hypothetical protein